MGVSTNAILAFGFDLGEDLPEALVLAGSEDPDEGDDERGSFDFETWVKRNRCDAKEPDHGDYSRDWPEYWEACRQAVRAVPFDLIAHCSYDFPMRFLAARGTQATAHRGSPEPVTFAEATPEQVAAMRAFCGEYGIEWQEPRWHIFSMRG